MEPDGFYPAGVIGDRRFGKRDFHAVGLAGSDARDPAVDDCALVFNQVANEADLANILIARGEVIQQVAHGRDAEPSKRFFLFGGNAKDIFKRSVGSTFCHLPILSQKRYGVTAL